VGTDITVQPNERVKLTYDGTTARWRVSKLNISGVTSNGTTVDVAALLTGTSLDLSSNLTVNGTTTLANALEVDGTTQLDDTVDINAAVDMDSGLTMSGGSDITFSGTTGQSKILLTDNLANALAVAESTNDYLRFVTTNSSEAIHALKSLLQISPTAGIGYGTGAGGAQTQATDKSTAVTSNTITTAITMNNATLNAATTVSFTFTNSTIAATDQVIVTHQSAGTAGAYNFAAFPSAGSAVISVRNITAGNLSEAIVLRVSVYKAVSA
jgi:hypothetical protein